MGRVKCATQQTPHKGEKMKFKAYEIKKNHNRGLKAANCEFANIETEINIGVIKNAHVDNQGRVIVTDLTRSQYILGKTIFKPNFANRIANAINTRNISQIYQCLSGIVIVKRANQARQASILESMRKREEASREKRKREQQIIEVAQNIELSDDELAAIEAA